VVLPDWQNHVYLVMQKKVPIASVIQGTTSVPTPSAQITAQCAAGCLAESWQRQLVVARDALALHGKELACLVDFLIATGCRVSEALRIKPYDITIGGRIILKGSKGSKSAQYCVPECSQYFISCKKSGREPFGSFSRFQIYRIFKKHGISHTFGENQKASVTHLPRHIMALDITATTEDKQIVSDALRHKNEKNREFYEQV
jgi:integrase